MITEKVSKAMAGKDLEVEEVYSAKPQPKCTKRIDKGEQIFYMILPLQDKISDMEDCDENDIREYRKEAKKSKFLNK